MAVHPQYCIQIEKTETIRFGVPRSGYYFTAGRHISQNIPDPRNLAFPKFHNKEIRKLTFNYAEEKRRFEARWEKTSRFYTEQGMSPESIAQMREYDWNWFKAQRIEALHTQELHAPSHHDSGETSRPENLFLERYTDRLTTEYDAFGGHSRFWWIEEISSPRLIPSLPKLTEHDKNILTMYFVEGYSQAECAGILHIDQGTFSRHLNAVLHIFTEK